MGRSGGTSYTLAPLVIVLAASVAGCENKTQGVPPPPPEPRPAVSAMNLIDASLLGDPIDPPAPAGDLKQELERFVNVDSCVLERAKLDPLVGDALGAIGYETFLRDACRLLEAAKDKKREVCDRIDSSALRHRCQAWVAIVSQLPDGCPLQFEGLVSRGRNPSCVAIASKDPRLCAAEPRASQRGTCEALVLRDPQKCEEIAPAQRPLCQREVTRWRALLAAPLEGLEKLPVPRGKIVVRGTSGTPDPPSVESDVAVDFARGVVAVTSRDRTLVELGTVAESEAARIAASPQKRARVGIAVLLPESSSNRGIESMGKREPSLHKLELELPGEAPIVSPPVVCECKLTTARVAGARGGELVVQLEGTLHPPGKSYKLTVDASTFVRDVVAESAGGGAPRVVPPVHPAIRGVGLDAGLLR